jgi:hypothetical protein
MARPDGRIEKGQRLASAISARAWNRAQEAADRVLGVTPGVEAEGGGAYGAPYSRIKVQASFTSDSPAWPRWSPVFLINSLHGYAPKTNPTTDAEKAATSSFEEMPIFTALGNPAYTISNSRLAGVLLEPLKAGQIGWAAVAGIVQTKIFNKAPNRLDSPLMPALYARLAGGSELQGPAQLVTDWFEGYRILWREHGRRDEESWALVDLSNHHCQQIVRLQTTQFVPLGSSVGSFKPYAHHLSNTFLLPDAVNADNNLIPLDAGVDVWALHPGAYDLWEASEGFYRFTVIGLAEMTKQFEARLGPEDSNNSHVTLKTYPRNPPL